MPLSCAAARPCATCAPYSAALRAGSAPALSRSRSDSPSRSSVTA
jgi:hypothetical protein